MHTIFPLSSQYLITHHDLVKFGVHNPQGAKDNFDKSIPQNKKEKFHISYYLPQIICFGETENIITIRRKRNKNKFYEVKANKKNGHFIEITKGFSDILKFDPTTFSSENKISLDNVGYWNILNKYVKPKFKNNNKLFN